MEIDIFDEIVVAVDVDTVDAGRKGVVLGISQTDDCTEVYAYAVMFHGDDIVTMVPKDDARSTGIKFKEEDYY